MPQIDAHTAFWPMSWSADGQRLVGLEAHPDGSTPGAAVYELATRRFTLFPISASSWASVIWLFDSERFLLHDDRGIWLVHSGTRAKKLLVPVGGYTLGRSVGITRDGRWITYTETGTEGEIWLATMKR
jgi:hypothetical protein